MLTLYHDGKQYPIDNTEYYIRELSSGLDEIIFSISIHDPIYAILQEEEQVTDRAEQRYLVKQIDAGASTAKVICQIDLDDWKSRMLVEYNSGSLQVGAQIENIAPTGWTVEDRSLITMRRTIQGDYTPFGICEACREIYQVYIRWDNARKVCTIIPKALANPVGSFATRQLNLKEINYKGKSTGFITRLYCYGKRDDAGVALSLQGATINGSTYQYPYVENHTYSSKVICGYWIDERYTDPQSLYDDALAKLSVMAVPDRSYDCAIVDLQATNPELYGNLDFSLFTTATLIDDIKDTAINYMVVERHVYPYHPESNEVIFSSSPIKITNELTNIVEAVENPNSNFQQIMSTRIEAATNWLLSGDGYVVAVKDSQGNWKELLFMDTADIATARKVLRINENGIGFSNTGANGPYTNAWTIDGQLVADFITTGTMSANRVRTGTLESIDRSVICDLDNGTLTMGNKALRITAGNLQLDANGNVKITGAITATSLTLGNGVTVPYSNVSGTPDLTVYVEKDGTIGSTPSATTTGFKVSSAGLLTASNAVIYGTLYSSSGEIGGWTLAANRLHSGSGTNYVSLDSATGDTYAIWAGAENPASAPFRVSRRGELQASQLRIDATGDVNSHVYSYDIGGVRINMGEGSQNTATFFVNVENAAVWAYRLTMITRSGGLLGSLERDGDSDGNPNMMRLRFTNGLKVGADGGEWFISGAYAWFKNGWSDQSDIRSKQDIEYLNKQESYEIIMGLKPARFAYKTDPDHIKHGFIAQDVQKIVHDWDVVRESESGMLGLSYNDFIADLVATVQYQDKRIEELERCMESILSGKK